MNQKIIIYKYFDLDMLLNYIMIVEKNCETEKVHKYLPFYNKNKFKKKTRGLKLVKKQEQIKNILMQGISKTNKYKNY